MDAQLTWFAERLLRFDPEALIRLQGGRAWGRLPWDVLVSVPFTGTGDRVISARTGEPRDAGWRGVLPSPGRVVETLPAAAVREVAGAAARTLREASATGVRGRAVGQRALRDALLDHPVITGTSDADGTQFVVPQRLVQGIVRFWLLRGDTVDVLVSGPWTGLRTPLGEAWHRSSTGLTIRPLR